MSKSMADASILLQTGKHCAELFIAHWHCPIRLSHVTTQLIFPNRLLVALVVTSVKGDTT